MARSLKPRRPPPLSPQRGLCRVLPRRNPQCELNTDSRFRGLQEHLAIRTAEVCGGKRCTGAVSGLQRRYGVCPGYFAKLRARFILRGTPKSRARSGCPPEWTAALSRCLERTMRSNTSWTARSLSRALGVSKSTASPPPRGAARRRGGVARREAQTGVNDAIWRSHACRNDNSTARFPERRASTRPPVVAVLG